MKFKSPISVVDLSKKLNTQLKGNDQIMVTGMNEIHKVEEGDLTFVDHPKYYDKSLNSNASVILIDKEVEVPEGKAVLICEKPFKAYNQLAIEQRPFSPLSEKDGDTHSIHPSAIIEQGVTIANNVSIGEGTYIQAGAYIGEYTIIGKNVTIQAGAIIGTDAFYFKKEDNKYHPWRSCGRVVVHDNVQIGAGCTINKGVSGDTVIGRGTKLDCLVHIAHGAVLGEDCLLAAQVGIAGKTIVGDRCIFYGQVGVAQSLVIGDDVIVYAKSGVSKNLEGGKHYFGAPAIEAKKKYRELAALRGLANSK